MVAGKDNKEEFGVGSKTQGKKSLVLLLIFKSRSLRRDMVDDGDLSGSIQYNIILASLVPSGIVKLIVCDSPLSIKESWYLFSSKTFTAFNALTIPQP